MGNTLEWLFLLCCIRTYVTGDSNVTGSLQPVLGLIGHDVILPCHLEPPSDVSGLTIEWFKLNSIDGLVHLWRNGRDVRNRNPFYKNRTSLLKGELENGNVSLKLSRAQISDEGMYRCYLPSLNGLVKKAVIELKIGTVSKPRVSVMEPADGGVVLLCESGGWYPEPEVEWLDSEGHVLPAYGNISIPTSRYDVKMKVTVAGKGRFTCRVVQLEINQTRETYIDVTDEIFQCSSSGRDIGIGVSVVMVILTVALIAGVVAVIFYRRNVAGHIQDQQGDGNQVNLLDP